MLFNDAAQGLLFVWNLRFLLLVFIFKVKTIFEVRTNNVTNLYASSHTIRAIAMRPNDGGIDAITVMESFTITYRKR